MHIYAGTSGYSYKEWKGKFYPEKLPANQMLGFYAKALPAVEINNTFYRMPKENVLDNWRRQVPDSFRFAVKASQRISHKKRLKDAEEETSYLLDAVQALGSCLGIVLFQMPPYFRKDSECLKNFLDTLPTSLPCAFEFRHESWFDEDVFDALREHNKTLCTADETNSKFFDIVRTADVGYLRLRRIEYSQSDLTRWAKAVVNEDWSECFVFFKHEDDCGGPELAQSFLQITKDLACT